MPQTGRGVVNVIVRPPQYREQLRVGVLETRKKPTSRAKAAQAASEAPLLETQVECSEPIWVRSGRTLRRLSASWFDACAFSLPWGRPYLLAHMQDPLTVSVKRAMPLCSALGY